MSSPSDTRANTGGSTSQPAIRRGSQGAQGIAFSGLINQKRNSVDAAAAARRASFNEMKPQPGFFGKMWNGWVSGSPGAASSK